MFDFLFGTRKKDVQSGGQIADIASNSTELNSFQNSNLAHSPADILIESKYYEKYKRWFDNIRYSGKNEPAYKYTWLIESLDMGHELEDDGYYVFKSIEDNLPYFCETESEYNQFTRQDKPVLKGSVSSILDVALFYLHGNEQHPNKAKYWKQKIVEMALCGNYEAQAALCTKMATWIFGEDEANHFKRDYETTVWKHANDGDAEAQLAVGEFLTPFPSEERVKWLAYAASQGLTDAWYYLAKVTFAWTMFDENGKQRLEPLQAHEIANLRRKEANAYLQGAEANNGVMAAECQCQVAWRYEDGDDVFPYDLEKAYHWYQMAQSNGADVKYALQRITAQIGGT